MRDDLPKYSEYYVAIVRSLRALGGTASISEIEEAASVSLELSDAALALPQPRDKRSKFKYQLAWARTHLRSRGIILNVSRGRWKLAQRGLAITDDALRQLENSEDGLPSIPKQGPGPKFGLSNGQIAFAETDPPQSDDVSTLDSFRPVLAEAASALVLCLAADAGLWPHLERSANRYVKLIDQPTSQLSISRIFGEGVILKHAFEEAKRQETMGNAFPVANEPALLGESLLEMHGTFIMLSSEGRAFALGAKNFRASNYEASRDAETTFSDAVVSVGGPILPDVKKHVADLVRSTERQPTSLHGSTYKTAMLTNIAVAITGAALISALGGLAGLGVGAAALLLGNEVLKKTQAFKSTTERLAALVDGGLSKFFQENEDSIKAIAEFSQQKDFTDAVDWLVVQNEVSDSEISSEDDILQLKALIIEPEFSHAQRLQDDLKKIGVRPLPVARTLTEAVQLAFNLKPDFVITEVVLADGSSGMDAINEISTKLQIRSIFLTSYPERLLTNPRPEPTFLVTKPYTFDLLQQAIENAPITRPASAI